MVGALQGSVSDALILLATSLQGQFWDWCSSKPPEMPWMMGWAWPRQLGNNIKLGSREYTGGQEWCSEGPGETGRWEPVDAA